MAGILVSGLVLSVVGLCGAFWPESSKDFNVSSFFNTEKGTVNSKFVVSVAMGKHLAVAACQEQFKWDQWDCPTKFFMHDKRQFLTREVAYVQAIRAAALTYQIAKNCTRGELPGCECTHEDIQPMNDQNGLNMNKTWGCSDRIDQGEKTAKFLLEDGEKEQDLLARAFKHNNIIGRIVVRESLTRQCLCKNRTGRCDIQVCWMELPPFHVIAKQLKDMYSRAIRLVDAEKEASPQRRRLALDKNLDSVMNDVSRHLVYMQDSPNYCVADSVYGWSGTFGRVCSKRETSTDTDVDKRNCKTLCSACGYKVRKTVQTVMTSCNCKFEWCCKIKCETCAVKMNRYTCS